MNKSDEFDFVAQSHMIAHDVKGAVGNMILFADLLTDELSDQDEEAKSYVKHIDFTGKKLIILLETWTELTERLSGTFHFEKATSSATTILEKVFKLLRFELHQRNIQLNIHAQGSFTVPIEADTLEKVLVNLILGCITFMDPNSSFDITLNQFSEKITVELKLTGLEGGDEFFDLMQNPISHPSQILYDKGAIKPAVCGAHYICNVMQEIGGSVSSSKEESFTFLTMTLPNPS